MLNKMAITYDTTETTLDYTITIPIAEFDRKLDERFWAGFKTGTEKISLENCVRFAAFCDCCGMDGYGTKEELSLAGWTFSPGAEFCPMHGY